MTLCVVRVTVIASMLYYDYVFDQRSHTTRCSIKDERASISTLFVVALPRPSNTHFQRLVIRPRVCRIERTPSRTRRCQRWVLDAPTRLVMELQDAAPALGEPLLCAFTSVTSRLYLHSRGRRTVCRTGTLPRFTGRRPRCGRGWPCMCLEHPFLLVQLILDLQCHLLVDTLCDVCQVLISGKRVKLCFFFNARVLTSSKASALLRCGKTFWTSWKHQSNSDVGFRASVSRHTSSHDKPRKWRVSALKAASAAVRNSGLLSLPGMNTSVMPGGAASPTSLSA